MQHPEQIARTRRFTLGRPRTIKVLPATGRVLYLRSDGPFDPVLRLRMVDVATGEDRVLVDPAWLGDGDGTDLPPEEQARRERAREAAGGIVGYTTDRDGEHAAFVLDGKLWRVEVGSGTTAAQDAPAGAYDPHLDPTGARVGFVAGGRFLTVAAGEDAVEVAADPDAEVTWGVADFVAAEEMGRQRGFWWSPDGEQVLVARVDNRPVPTWHIADPANPSREPSVHRYPAAGTTNAEVSLALFPPAGGAPTDVTWDSQAFPYLADVRWSPEGPCLLVVQSRDQRTMQYRSLDAVTGQTELVEEVTGDPWLEVPVGAPRWLSEGRLLTIVDRPDVGTWGTRSLAVNGVVQTPADLQVSHVIGVDEGGAIWFGGTDDAVSQHVYTLVLGDVSPRITRVTDGAGVHGAVVGGDVHVVSTMRPDAPTLEVTVSKGEDLVATIASLHDQPVVRPAPRFLELGKDGLRAALLLPTGDTGSSPLPVILDPYGGPHAQRCVAANLAFTTSQWLADQGFAVLVVDGRGTPSRGPGWEHRIHLDFAAGVLDDQVEALHAAAELEPRLDLSRVAIRGWSFGGYLSALAVLRRPDVFHAGVAGAPVTDWRLYDTHYTERYLGHPDQTADAYRASSLIDDEGLVDAAAWDPRNPPKLLIVHGLADDNVVAAHSLRLSAALLADGRQHRFLPLSGVTHMTPQVVVAQNLLLLELDFLQDALAR